MDRQRKFDNKGKGQKARRTTVLNRVTNDQGSAVGYQSVTTQARRQSKGKSYREKTLTPVFDAAGNQVGFEKNVTRYRSVNQRRKDKARGRGVEYAPGDEKGAQYVVKKTKTAQKKDAKNLPGSSRMNTSIGSRARAYGGAKGYGGTYSPIDGSKPQAGDDIGDSSVLRASGMGRYSRNRRKLAKQGVEDFNANRRLTANLRQGGSLRDSRKLERERRRYSSGNPYGKSYKGGRFNPDAGFKGMVNRRGSNQLVLGGRGRSVLHRISPAPVTSGKYGVR